MCAVRSSRPRFTLFLQIMSNQSHRHFLLVASLFVATACKAGDGGNTDTLPRRVRSSEVKVTRDSPALRLEIAYVGCNNDVDPDSSLMGIAFDVTTRDSSIDLRELVTVNELRLVYHPAEGSVVSWQKIPSPDRGVADSSARLSRSIENGPLCGRYDGTADITVTGALASGEKWEIRAPRVRVVSGF